MAIRAPDGANKADVDGDKYHDVAGEEHHVDDDVHLLLPGEAVGAWRSRVAALHFHFDFNLEEWEYNGGANILLIYMLPSSSTLKQPNTHGTVMSHGTVDKICTF